MSHVLVYLCGGLPDHAVVIGTGIPNEVTIVDDEVDCVESDLLVETEEDGEVLMNGCPIKKAKKNDLDLIDAYRKKAEEI
jgi:hypothetical protein